MLKDDGFWQDAKLEDLTTNIKTQDCSPGDSLNRWTIWSISNLSLELLLCGSDHLVKIQLYPRVKKGYLAALVSIDGNHGQTQDFEFFWLDDQYNVIAQESQKNLGITEAHWNDFIDSKKFSSRENYPANIMISEDGTIEFYPWTWMEPSWENRKITKRIYYSWDGSKFRRHIVTSNLSQPIP